MITLEQYLMGRDKLYPLEISEELLANAEELLGRVNGLLERWGGETPRVNSGWRPRAVNAATAGAAPRSKHITGHAIDLADPDGELDSWCMDSLPVLIELGLWLEHPGATKGWCHLQSLPPGNPPRASQRVFWP